MDGWMDELIDMNTRIAKQRRECFIGRFCVCVFLECNATNLKLLNQRSIRGYVPKSDVLKIIP